MSVSPLRRIAALVPLIWLANCRSAPASASGPSGATTPTATAQSLLAADRAYSALASSLRFADALGRMFADGIMMPARDNILVGRAAVLGAFSTSPDTASTLSWTPVRVGVSADGLHGVTVGFMLATRPDGTRAASKYLAYWIRDKDTWKVAAWRRRPMATVAFDSTMLPPMLPAQRVGRERNPDRIASHRRELMAAEQRFSDEANRIGVGTAFALFGDSVAVNAGAPTDPRFIVGPQQIAKAVSGDQPLNAPSTIVWRADTALVASSGDLGITFGIIRAKHLTAGAPGGAAFFTIWQKSSRTAPWRYVAE